MKKFVKVILPIVFVISLFCSIPLTEFNATSKTRSIDYNGSGVHWINQGNSIYFNEKIDGKCLNGKLYLNDFTSGSIRFDFYEYPSGKLILTHSKSVASNPEQRDWYGYSFNLDKDNLKGYLLIKVTTNPSTWGTLVY